MTITYESFLLKGKLVYQTKEHIGINHKIVYRAVRQHNGSWWMYSFYEPLTDGQKPHLGVPVRGKKHQTKILEFVEKVKQNLGG